VSAGRGDRRTSVGLAVAGACALGFAVGWNVSNLGAVAEPLADSYGVGLATIGLFTTAFFVAHLAMQIPGGKASDRHGARRAGLAGLALVACANGLALVAPEPALAIVARALTGVGTGLAFVSGAAYVRAAGASSFAQGMFGGIGLAGGGVALAVVPPVEDWIDWRAPYVTALVATSGALLLLLACPADSPVRMAVGDRHPAGILRDARLYRLAVLYAASLGLSIVVSNWVVTQLDREGGVSRGAAGAIGALTLLLGVVTRPLGGWIMGAHPDRTRAAVGASLAAGALGTLALTAAEPPALAAAPRRPGCRGRLRERSGERRRADRHAAPRARVLAAGRRSDGVRRRRSALGGRARHAP
jgi:nitrate/nitrite transporter NarK